MAEYEEYQEYDEYYDEPQRDNRTWLIVAIVVAVILCCCCLALVSGFTIWGEDIIEGLEDISGVLPALGEVIALA